MLLGSGDQRVYVAFLPMHLPIIRRSDVSGLRPSEPSPVAVPLVSFRCPACRCYHAAADDDRIAYGLIAAFREVAEESSGEGRTCPVGRTVVLTVATAPCSSSDQAIPSLPRGPATWPRVCRVLASSSGRHSACGLLERVSHLRR